MKIKRISSVAIAAALLSSSAFAADGTITFTGSITAQTCVVRGNGGGSADFTVTLPSVPVSALSAAAAVAGRTEFTINLTGCGAAGGRVHTFFEAGPTTDSTGRLSLTAPGAGANNAQGVQIQLLNADASPILAGAQDVLQLSQAVDITNGVATLRYYAQYYAIGTPAVTAGSANSRVVYTLAYQ